MAFIFADKDLANNLLGLVPFANLGCTGVFKPRSFHIYREGKRTPILSGARTAMNSMWQVPLRPDLGHHSDGIPPPQPSTAGASTSKLTLSPSKTTPRTCD